MDDELRTLEQALATRGDAETRLRLAHALGRAGREAERLATLVAGREDPAVRRELGCLPAWSIQGGPGQARFVDVPLLLSPPRLRWQLGGTYPEEDPQGWSNTPPPAWAVASPLGIALMLSPPGVAVLDPETGERRWRLENEQVDGLVNLDLALAGDVLLLHQTILNDHVTWAERLVARDLWTGEPLWERSGTERGKLLGLELPDPRTPPLPGWGQPVPASSQGKGLVAVGTRLLLWQGAGDHSQRHLEVVGSPELLAFSPCSQENEAFLDHAALDPASGVARWRSPGRGVVVDGAGVICHHEGWHVRDATGRLAWSRIGSEVERLLGVTPELVLATGVGPIGNQRLLALDRATGALRWGHAWPRPGATALARGAAYTLAHHNVDDLCGLDLRDGRIAWKLDARALSGRDGLIEQLIPLPGRLLVVASDGGLTCLEPGR